MQKSTFLILCIVIILGLCGCAGMTTIADNTLGEDEFYVYNNGKAIKEPFDSSFSSIMDASQKGIDGFENIIPETKRGIKIGDTLEKVSEKYSGIPITIFQNWRAPQSLNQFPS